MDSGYLNDGYSEGDAIRDMQAIVGQDMDSLDLQERSAQIVPEESSMGPDLIEDDDDNPDCGWFQYRPRFIQVIINFYQSHLNQCVLILPNTVSQN